MHHRRFMVLTKKYPMIDTTLTKTKQKAHCDMTFFSEMQMENNKKKQAKI